MILKGLMLAASETVAITLEWAMLELVCHPHVMQRLQSELDASFEGISGHMDEGIATQLPYLQVSTIHPKLCNINLHNVTHSLIPQNPRKWILSQFSPLYHVICR